MTKSFRTRFFALTLAMLAVMATSVLYRAVNAGQSSPQGVQLRNKTKSLQISSTLETNGGQTYVVLKITNTSKKAIVAYGFVTGPGQTLVCDGSTTAVELAPFGEETKQFPLPEKGFTPELSALVFEGGETEGDLQAAAYLKDTRKGVKAQFEQALQILKTERANSSLSLPIQVQNIREKLTSLPGQQSHSIASRGIDSGLGTAKQFLAYQLQEIEEELQKGKPDANVSLGRLISHLENALGKLEKEAR